MKSSTEEQLLYSILIRQPKLLRIITGAPWYIINTNLHYDPNTPIIREEIKNNSTHCTRRLVEHQNHLVRNLITSEGHRRLTRLEMVDRGRLI